MTSQTTAKFSSEVRERAVRVPCRRAWLMGLNLNSAGTRRQHMRVARQSG
jgi:hypothetical protein